MAHECPPRFQVRQEHGCTIVTASGPEIEFDSKDELYALAEVGALEPRQIVLNLEHVVNFKSAILGVLIQFQRRIEKAGGRLKVVCLDPDVLLMFHITKVDLVLDLHTGERLAIDAFRGGTRSCVTMA
jgi:anti-sigma B factor antagonist